MPVVFQKLDKIKPLYDMADKVIMIICKVLLIIDILVTCLTVLGRYIPFIKDPVWSEEVILSCMVYMAVISASLAIRRNAHIRMSALDPFLPKKLVMSLDVLADIGVMAFSIILLTVGWKYAVNIGGKGYYTSMPWLSKFWQYFPIPLAGLAAIIFEAEALYNHIKAFFIKEGEAA